MKTVIALCASIGAMLAFVAMVVFVSQQGPVYSVSQMGTLRSDSAKNLSLLAQALLDYHNKHGHFPPPAMYNADGRPAHSWRTLILPQLGYGDLFENLRLDEPWDSNHNLTVLNSMPNVYRHPLQGRSDKRTYYQVLVGKGAAFEDRRSLDLGKDFLGVPLETILIVEGENAVPWTKPGDISYDPNGPLPRLGGPFGGTFLAALVTGQVVTYSNKMDESYLRSKMSR